MPLATIFAHSPSDTGYRLSYDVDNPVATGTVIYVIFFEIFPKAKVIGGTGFQHVISMLAGFAIFLPSLLLRKYLLLLEEKMFQGCSHVFHSLKL